MDSSVQAPRSDESTVGGYRDRSDSSVFLHRRRHHEYSETANQTIFSNEQPHPDRETNKIKTDVLGPSYRQHPVEPHLRVPDPHGLVSRPRDDEAAVGGEDDGVYCSLVALEYRVEAFCRKVPDLNGM